MTDSSTHPLANSNAFCIDCAYPLNQLEPTTRRCPECGRTFDPADPWSMITARPIPDSLRWSLRPARWLYPAVRLVVILGLLADVPLAGFVIHAWILLGLIWLPVGIVYFIRRRLRAWVVWHYHQDAAMRDADREQILRSRRLIVVAILLLLFRVPFYAAFLPSLHWLNKVAHEEYAIKPYDSPRPTYTFIGLMPVVELRVGLGGVTLFTGLGALAYRETFDDKHWWELPKYSTSRFLPW